MRGLRVVVSILASCLAGGCGRVGFTEIFDEGSTLDARDGDATTADPNGLLVRYPMDDDPADGLLDTSGFSRDAACESCPILTAGVRGSATDFGGSSFATVNGPWLDTLPAYTVVAWISIASTIDQIALFKPFGGGPDATWSLAIRANKLCMDTLAGQVLETICRAAPPVGTWVHVALRWTGTTKAFIVDGVTIDEFASTASAFDGSGFLIGIGANDANPAMPWGGRLDEVELYARGLSDAEIAALRAR